MCATEVLPRLACALQTLTLRNLVLNPDVRHVLSQNEILISFAVDITRAEFLPFAREFRRLGFTFVGTPGTADYFCRNGVSLKNVGFGWLSCGGVSSLNFGC